jgi:hypothetical protein
MGGRRERSRKEGKAERKVRYVTSSPWEERDGEGGREKERGRERERERERENKKGRRRRRIGVLISHSRSHPQGPDFLPVAH